MRITGQREEGMFLIGIRKTPQEPMRVVLKTWSRSYALRVRRKWLKAGYEVIFEEIQQDEDS